MDRKWRKENVHKKSSQRLFRRSSRTHHDALNRRPPRLLPAILPAISLGLGSAARAELSPSPHPAAPKSFFSPLCCGLRANPSLSPASTARENPSPTKLLPPSTLPIYFWSPRNQGMFLFSSFLFPSLFLRSIHVRMIHSQVRDSKI